MTIANCVVTYEQSVVDGIVYRPDPNLMAWRFAVDYGGPVTTTVTTNASLWSTQALGPGWWLTVQANVWDSTSGQASVIVHHLPMALADHPTRHELLREILRLVVAIETHEVMENLRYGDQRVCDPHDPVLLYAPPHG